MPTWLVHGFRWPRTSIRIHIILQNLEDCAPEWLMAPATTACMTENFKKLYPEMMVNLPSLRFIEQYDPEDIVTKDQPYAYVCDQVHEVQLGVDIDEVRGQGVPNEAWAALVDLRDKVAPGEKVAWYVVVNGDVERWAPPLGEEEEDDNEVQYESQLSPISQRSSVGRIEDDDSDQTKKEPKGFKKWFRRSKSSKDLRGEFPIRSAGPPSSPPAVPNIPRNIPISAPKTTAPLPRNLNGRNPNATGTAI